MKCLERQTEAAAAGVPLSCLVTVCGPTNTRYISVYEPAISYYSRQGRVIVTYNSRQLTWHCPCIKARMSSVHKNVVKWHLFHTEANLFRRVRTVEDPESSHRPIEEEMDEDEDNAQYPPEGNILRQMLTYIFEHKKIPTVLPPDELRPDKYPEQLFPSELFCMECPDGTPLSEAVLITSKAKILTVTNVIEGMCFSIFFQTYFDSIYCTLDTVLLCLLHCYTTFSGNVNLPWLGISTYRRNCHRCGMIYRYQEWTDGVHNFDDHIFISHHLSLYLRNSLQV